MKRLLIVWAAVWLCAASVSGAEKPFQNNPLPQHPDTLRILAVGNSFSDDGMMYLPDLLREAGVGSVVLGRLFFAGCSLERHCRFYEERAARYTYSKSENNSWYTVSREASLIGALADERWDIIVVQQSSTLGGIYESYSPWLEKLLTAVLHHTDNPRLCVAWHMTWSYASDCTRNGYEAYGCDPLRMAAETVAATRRMVADTGIDIVIPSGTAIQNLRLHGTPSVREFTRDGFHLDMGIGRYAAACTWFEALIAPIYGCTVEGNAFRTAGSVSSATPVTESNAADCQHAACLAVQRPFQTTLFP